MIIVDDEILALQNLTYEIKAIHPDYQVDSFTQAADALRFAKDNAIDIAFLDIELPGINGISLAKQLKDDHPKINIIFVTGYSDYVRDAMRLRASGYVMKPVTREAIVEELENLRNPLPRNNARIRVQTFGNFEVFVDNRPVSFHRARSKEILAYLVDRKGTGVGRPELATILWENRLYTRAEQKQLQTFLSDMMKALRAANAETMIIKQPGSICVDPTAFECDYYSFLAMEAWAVNGYRGEYMTNYSWAEFTLGYLDQISRR